MAERAVSCATALTTARSTGALSSTGARPVHRWHPDIRSLSVRALSPPKPTAAPAADATSKQLAAPVRQLGAGRFGRKTLSAKQAAAIARYERAERVEAARLQALQRDADQRAAAHAAATAAAAAAAVEGGEEVSGNDNFLLSRSRSPSPPRPVRSGMGMRAQKQPELLVIKVDARSQRKPTWMFGKTEEGPLNPEHVFQEDTLREKGMLDDVLSDRDPRFQMATWNAVQEARYWEAPGAGAAVDSDEGFAAAAAAASRQSPFAQYRLPDGALIRCYHKGIRRHAYHPLPEGPDPWPLTLASVGESSLPPPPRAPFPSEATKPGLRSHVHASAPIPDRHTLPVSHPDVWYGTLPTEALSLVAVPFAPVQLEEWDIATVQPKPWDIDTSIFAPRRRVVAGSGQKPCDAFAYTTTATVLKRGFALDWERCRSVRFQRLIAREDDDGLLGLDVELEEVRYALESHVETLYTVYSYYCTSGEAYDNYVLGMKEWSQFLDDCHIPDPTTTHCRKTDLISIFMGACPSEDQGAFALGFDRALLRHQWLQVIVRVAIAKYIKTGLTADVSEALDELIAVDILPNVSPFAHHDHDRFRNDQLYSEATEIAILKYWSSLKEIYRRYSSSDEDNAAASKAEQMSLVEWRRLMKDAAMLDGRFTKRESNLCVIYSQCFVADEVNRRNKLVQMTFVDFLEALGRIAVFKPLPTLRDFAKLELHTGVVIENCARFFDVLWATQGDHGIIEFNESHELDWRVEETNKGRPLPETIELVVQLLIARIDRDGDGKISRKDWKYRRADFTDPHARAKDSAGARLFPSQY